MLAVRADDAEYPAATSASSPSALQSASPLCLCHLPAPFRKGLTIALRKWKRMASKGFLLESGGKNMKRKADELCSLSAETAKNMN